MSEINFQEVIEGNYGITNLKAYEDYKRAVSVRGGPTADEVKSLSPDNINSCSFWEYIAKNPEIAKDAVAFGITKEQSIKDVNAGNFRLACQISALSFFLAYKDVENMPIMDIGAGYGMLKDFVKEHTKLAYYGVDVYPKIEGVYPVGPDGSTLPPNIAGSLFGIIASINVFQHFSVKQRRHYYEQIEKMLYPKFGIFTVTISTYRPGSSSRMPFHCKDDDKWYVCHYGQYTEVQTYEQVLEDLVKHFEIQSIIHRCMDDTFTFHCKKKADTTFDKTPSTQYIYWMNVHVPKDIHDKYPTYEFLGKPIKLKNGKNYMRAHHKTLERTLFYCFQDDFFYFERSDFDVFGGLTGSIQWCNLSSQMKCECCGEEACGNFTWGLYDYTIPGTKEKIKRTEPMYNANLCKKCSDDLWNKIRGAVNAGYYHFTAKRL